MKITLELEKKIVTIESDGIDIHDAIELMKDALLAIGFHPDLVKANFEDEGDSQTPPSSS